MTAPPLDLDFERPRATPWRVLSWCLLALSVAAVVWMAERQQVLHEALETESARYEVLTQRARPSRESAPSAPDAAAQQRISRANAAIQRLTLPWERLFASIESADMRGLALLSLEPTVGDSTVRISGEARTVTDVLSYVERLARQPGLSQVHVLNYDTVQRDGVTVIAFALSARWAPA